jgi:Domain of unknown function (DUF5664)
MSTMKKKPTNKKKQTGPYRAMNRTQRATADARRAERELEKLLEAIANSRAGAPAAEPGMMFFRFDPATRTMPEMPPQATMGTLGAAPFDQPGKTYPAADTGGVQFNGGSRRASKKPLYHLVPIELLAAVAETRRHGDLKYEPGNWKRGDRAFFLDCINHTIEHLYGAVDLEDFDGIIEHLGHAATNIGFMLWALRRGVIARDDFEQAAVILEGRPDGRVLR